MSKGFYDCLPLHNAGLTDRLAAEQQPPAYYPPPQQAQYGTMPGASGQPQPVYVQPGQPQPVQYMTATGQPMPSGTVVMVVRFSVLRFTVSGAN